jgi:hypothetical protein
MDAFRARTRASRSLFKNPAIQIGGLAVVLIASFVFIRASNKSKAERMAADTPIIREVDQQETELAQAQAEQRAARRAMNETSSASVTAPTIDAEQAPPTVASSASTDSVSAGGAPSGTTAGSPAAATPATGASLAAAKLVDGKPQAGIRAALQGPQNVRVYFIEAQRGFLNELMSDARDVSGDGVVNYGVVANLDQRLRNSRAWQSLDSSLDQPMKLNQPNMIFKGARDQMTGQNIGFTVQVIPLSRDEAGSHLQIDANRTLRDPMNGVDSVTFQMPESFSIPKGASVVITGVLPHRNVGPEEQAFYRSINVLKAMGGERFRSGATDVAIIVQTR